MSFLWQTALSVIDLGSSLIYGLLGRDLTENDIKTIELIFNHIAKINIKPLISKSQSSLASQISFQSITSIDLKKQFDLDRKQVKYLTKLLIQNLNSACSKDLLLITNKKTGYNLIQTLIDSLLQLSFNVLSENYKLIINESESSVCNLEQEFDELIKQRIDLLKVLLNTYSCDSNRGLLLSNKTKYCISLASDYVSSSSSNPTSHSSSPNDKLKPVNRTNKNNKPDLLTDSKSFKSNNALINFENNLSNDEDYGESKIDQSKIETDTLTELTCTFETMIKNKKFNNINNNNDSNSQLQADLDKYAKNLSHNSSLNPCSYITNVDLTNITHSNDESSINELHTIPIDTPLLIICCVYNSHNLLNLTNSTLSNSKKNIKNKNSKMKKPVHLNKSPQYRPKPQPQNQQSQIQLQTEQIDHFPSKPSFVSVSSTVKHPNISKPTRRRHTIHCDNLIEFQNMRKKEISRSNSIKSNTNQEHSDLYSLWSSSSGSESESESLNSSSFSSTSSLSFSSFNSSLISSYSKSLDSISKLFKSSFKRDYSNDHNYDDFNDDDDDDDLDEEKLSRSESSEDLNKLKIMDHDNVNQSELDDTYEDSDEDLEESDDDSVNDDLSSNIYDYDLEKDEQNYYDKYDYDINSNCFKLPSHNFSYDNTINHSPKIIISSLNKKQPSLSTSVHSLPSLTNKNDKANFKSTTCSVSTRSNRCTKNTFIFDKLNKQRLNLIDLLLKHGADKYLISKLSIKMLSKIGKKSKTILKKWYGIKSNNNKNNDSNTSQSDLNQSNDESDLENENYELKPLSPIMASLCLDDVDVFSRLYKHNQVLFNYFKPDEDYELIYYAIKFQSKNCLVYLLSNTNNENLPSLFENESSQFSSKLSHSSSAPILNSKHKAYYSCHKKEQKQLNKNVNTMFYILENTRSSKIIKVLLKCGFDLTKREPLTGNTALHCLFNPSTYNHVNSSFRFNKKILSEYHDPKSLSRILFIMLKNGGLKTHVNTLNYDRKLCTQILFEWDELIEIVFFKTINSSKQNEWKKEFKECIKLLLKAGADLLLNINNNEVENEGYHNCIETLLNSLLKHCIVSNKNLNDVIPSRNRSPSLPAIFSNKINESPIQNVSIPQKINLIKKRKFFFNKTLDIEFLYEILNEVIDLNSLSSNIHKANFYHHHHQLSAFQQGHTQSSETAHRLQPRDFSVDKYLEILFNVSIEDFSSAFNLLKILCNFQKSLNNKLKGKFFIQNTNSKYVNAQIVKKIITNWILYPNFLNSSNQFEKNNFIKSIVIELILNDLYDPNDSTSYCCINEPNNQIQSNNLLNHCVQLIFLSKTCYQLELIYDLMRTLIQYGANPNLEPYDFDSSFNYLSSISSSLSLSSSPSSTSPRRSSNSILAQLCEPLSTGRLSPLLTPINLTRSHHKYNTNTYSHHHHHHHHQHGNNYHQHHQNRKKDQYLEFRSANQNNCQTNFQHQNVTQHHNYYDDSNKEKNYSSEQNQSHQINNQTDRVIYNIANSPVINLNNQKIEIDHVIRKSPDSLNSPPLPAINKKLIPSNPILLLTPSPSFSSLLMVANNNSTIKPKSQNIVIDSSILFLNHYKRFVKLLYDSMETNKINEVVRSRNIFMNPDMHYCNHHNHHHSYHHIHYGHTQLRHLNLPAQNQIYLSPQNKVYEIESLDMYLERLTSKPRSLKSLSRRFILNRLVDVEKKRKQKDTNSNSGLVLISNQVAKLPLPKRIKNYLLFIE